MSTYEFIIALFCKVDDALASQVKHPRAKLWPSELVTLGILRTLKGLPFRAFYRWLTRNTADLFPNLPERTRLLRLLYTYCDLANAFLMPLKKKKQTGYLDSFGIELLHPRRDGRSDQQYGKKGMSNHRWIVGAKFCPLLDAKGNILDWNFDTANVHDSTFVHLVERNPSVHVLADKGFHRSQDRGGDPSNLTICQQGEENQRMLIETVFSLWKGTLHMKATTTRAEHHLEALLAFAVAAYNLIINWTGKTKLNTTFFSL